MLCNGIAGTLETLSPPVLAGLWFPVHERATATAIMATANTLGGAIGFSVAFIVPSNISDASSSNVSFSTSSGFTTSEEISSALTSVYWVMFGICCFVLLSMMIYFPSAPPTPPAASCSVVKVDILVGLKQLLFHGRFWTVTLCMAVPLGVYAAWLNVLDINLNDFGFSQTDAAWVGFGSATAGSISGLVTGRIADFFPGHLARIVSVLYTIAGICMIWFSLICFDVLPFSRPAVFLSSVLVGISMYGCYPLFFELCIETTFPIPEACTSAFLVMAQSAVQAVFLALPVDQMGTKWMNYTLIVCPFVCAITLALFK